ncbi:unnamed protein product [Brugia timori]|uniref:Uncharacterized protein n=1 Tax=Brugia timori TaxID=42155 RepID=A0A0R3R3Y3_9BILA|nr:unnamed protein product [Brugia timori]
MVISVYLFHYLFRSITVLQKSSSSTKSARITLILDR